MGQKRDRDEGVQFLHLTKRIEVVQRVKEQLANPSSVASQTVGAYADLLDDLFTEVVLDVHRGVSTGQIDLEDTVTDRNTLPAWVPYQKQTKSSRAVDAFGQLVSDAGQKEVACVHCGRSVAASRFAPHLENCLGMGRNGSRTARRKGDAAG